MDGGCHRGHCDDGVEVSSVILLSLLVLLALGLKQFVLGEEGLVYELGLVLGAISSPWPPDIALHVAGP